MSIFANGPDDWQRLDWRLLQDGGVTLYFRQTALETDLQWLRANHYDVYNFQSGSWDSELSLHQDFQATLGFPDYYGRNFNALNDCLRDLAVPDSGGTALVLQSFDAYASGAGAATRGSGRSDAEVVLNVLATASRTFLLYGLRFLTLVQSDDPKIHFDRLACISAHWNPKEWLNKNRGL
jgi:barstar (barnase inhibitor)